MNLVLGDKPEYIASKRKKEVNAKNGGHVLNHIQEENFAFTKAWKEIDKYNDSD